MLRQAKCHAETRIPGNPRSSAIQRALAAMTENAAILSARICCAVGFDTCLVPAAWAMLRTSLHGAARGPEPTRHKRMRIEMDQNSGVFAAVVYDEGLSVPTTRHEETRATSPQPAVFPCGFSLRNDVSLSSFALHSSAQREGMAHAWHVNGTPQQRLCNWSSKRRALMQRASHPPDPIPAPRIWFAFWPDRPRGISSMLRRHARSGTASLGKEAAA